MLNGSDRFAPLDILVSILDLRNEFVFPSIFQYITLSCLHQPPHTTLVVFYVSIPPFPCLPPLVSCLNHQVCFSSFFFFFSTLWFRSMLRKWQTVSSTGGEGGEKKESAAGFWTQLDLHVTLYTRWAWQIALGSLQPPAHLYWLSEFLCSLFMDTIKSESGARIK